ncbi:MAG: NAD(P)(+) transhydrogenase (Re/Si-specific) subunit beta, partial [Gemmatimonadota bacterium]
ATIVLSALIGGVTFSGSMIAFGKLQGLVTGRALVLPLQRPVHVLGALAAVGLGGLIVAGAAEGSGVAAYVGLNALALLLGVLLVLPIGGADMPVVVSLLNSFSGIAASMTGFVLHNNLLIIAGALVGASGLILTRIMCVAMNRSLVNVLFAGFGGDGGEGAGAAGDGTGGPGRIVREISPDDAAILLSYSRSVIFVPGYGMAVAQAQHQLRELSDVLRERGVSVKFAIHPVAGRMPGHMNVLLAEANVPYDRLVEMETINPEFERTEVAVVIGANDVVNPAARTVHDSPIYGMPILNADRAQNVIVMKRSLSPGFAGIDNELFYRDNTRMLFGDARDSLEALLQSLKQAA